MKLTIYFTDDCGAQHFKSVVEAEHESTSPINYEAVAKTYYEGMVDQAKAVDSRLLCDFTVDDVEYNKSGVTVALCKLFDRLDEMNRMGSYSAKGVYNYN
jgi:hypothetical protein